MISDGELRQMIHEGEELGYSTIVEALVELEAYRQGFGEPQAYATYDGRMLIFADSPNMLPEDKSNLTPLFRKPTIPE